MEYVTLKDLAQEFGLDRSSLRKYVLKQGLVPLSVRTPDSGAQRTLALSGEDAEQVREMRRAQGYGGQPATLSNGKGVFYVIQLVPDLRPQRIKLGFASELSARLDAHRTSAPTAAVVQSWPCRRVWEYAAIDAMTKEGCTWLSHEVFDAESVEEVVRRGDAFFALMPDVALVAR